MSGLFLSSRSIGQDGRVSKHFLIRIKAYCCATVTSPSLSSTLTARVTWTTSLNSIFCQFTICILVFYYTILIKGFITEHQSVNTMLRSLIRYPQYHCYFCRGLIYEAATVVWPLRIVFRSFVWARRHSESTLRRVRWDGFIQDDLAVALNLPNDCS